MKLPVMKWPRDRVAAIAGLLMVLSLLRSPASRSLAGVVLALAFGALAWYIVAVSGQPGKPSLGLKIAVTVSLLLVLGMIYDGLGLFLPRPGPSPADAKTRQAWARDRSTLSDAQGMGLAMSVADCFRSTGASFSVRTVLNGQCSALRRSWYGDGPDSIAKLGGYIVGDDGWRWDTAGNPPALALVFPDPLLVSQPGPVFEVRSHQILRKENRDAPGYYTSALLATIAKSLACLERRAAKLKGDGTWDGKGTTLPLVWPGAAEPGCASVRIEDQPSNPMAMWKLTLFGDGLPYQIRVVFRPLPSGRVTAYELRFFADGVDYLVDDAGNWHMRPGSIPGSTDPAPPACMLDPRIPCD
jgi:hypothetical protein